MTIVKLGLLASMALYNTPYPRQFTLTPDLTFEYRPLKWTYALVNAQARCTPANWHIWNPITATWIAEGGFIIGSATIGIGHQSQHGVETHNRNTESLDYVKLTYTFENK